MKKYFFTTLLFFFVTTMTAQQGRPGRFELSINHGLAGNFALDYEQPINEVPAGFISFYNKNFIGSSIGAEVILKLRSGKDALGLTYDRQTHVGAKNDQRMYMGSLITIEDFKLRHIIDLLGFYYRRSLSKNLFVTGGIFMVYPKKQEIDYISGRITVKERNTRNSNLSDAGFYVGVEYYFYQSGNFSLGLQSRLYHATSLGRFESLSLCPKLRYTF